MKIIKTSIVLFIFVIITSSLSLSGRHYMYTNIEIPNIQNKNIENFLYALKDSFDISFEDIDRLFFNNQIEENIEILKTKTKKLILYLKKEENKKQ